MSYNNAPRSTKVNHSNQQKVQLNNADVRKIRQSFKITREGAIQMMAELSREVARAEADGMIDLEVNTCLTDGYSYNSAFHVSRRLTDPIPAKAMFLQIEVDRSMFEDEEYAE